MAAVCWRAASLFGTISDVADIFSKRKRSQVMSAIRSTGNDSTEIRFASILRANRIAGWRRHLPLIGRPDFAFRNEKVVVFVDGCFWHGCRWHGRKPDSNKAYWLKKLAKNKTRDRNNARTLRRHGWNVLRFWQHELKSEARVVRQVLKALRRT